MAVRRPTWPFFRARAATLSAMLLLAPLAACSQQTAVLESTAGTRVDGRAGAASSGSPADPPGSGSAPHRPGAADPRTGPGAAPEVAPGGPPGSPGAAEPPRPGTKVLQGGGFARAVPGSDAPDRRVDVGPQYTVSEDLDIDEIERLVAAVERIALAQPVQQPLATGGSVAAAVGTFSYRWFEDGTVAPDPAWVAKNIRYGRVPILGTVRCHTVMLPQLRGALREIVARGLADEVHPEQYAGCYYPRFIGRDPRKGLSLHTWGIAVDLNVPGNQRGTAGAIDRDVVAIFKKWGFAWGGDWRWTDPMHFELAELVRPGR